MIVVMIASGRATTTLNRFVTLADQAEGEGGVTGASRWLYWPAAVRYYLSRRSSAMIRELLVFHKGSSGRAAIRQRGPGDGSRLHHRADPVFLFV
jgi:hypothetical protein